MRYLKNNLLVLTDDDPDDCEFFLDTIETINIDIPIQVFNGGDQLMEYLTNINSKLQTLSLPLLTGPSEVHRHFVLMFDFTSISLKNN